MREIHDVQIQDHEETISVFNYPECLFKRNPINVSIILPEHNNGSNHEDITMTLNECIIKNNYNIVLERKPGSGWSDGINLKDRRNIKLYI